MPGIDYRQERERALAESLKLHDSRYSQATETGALDRELIATAKAMFDFLVGPAFLSLKIGPVSKQDTGLPVANPLGGNPMQLRDDEQFTATVELTSSRGNPVADRPGDETDNVNWTVEGDAEGVLTLDVSEDSRTATVKAAGPVGSAVLRAEVGELFVTQAVDVVAGDAALMSISTSTPTKQESELPEPTPGEDEDGQPQPTEPPTDEPGFSPQGA